MITWGSMKTLSQMQADSAKHQKKLAGDSHCQCEQAYLDQAKREIDPAPYSAIEYIRAVLNRAQQIKQEQKNCQSK